MKEFQREPPSSGSPSEWHRGWAGPGLSREPELCPISPRETQGTWQGPRHLGHLLLPPRCSSRARTEAEQPGMWPSRTGTLSSFPFHTVEMPARRCPSAQPLPKSAATCPLHPLALLPFSPSERSDSGPTQGLGHTRLFSYLEAVVLFLISASAPVLPPQRSPH